jgi:hypothetical protein
MALPRQTSTAPLIPSWNLVPKNLELLRQRVEQVTLIVILPTLFIDLGGVLMPSHSLIGWLVLIGGVAWWFLNIGASYYLQVSAAKEKIVSTADCYRKSWQYIGRIIAFTVIFSVIIFIGFLLLIVPGLILLRRYILTTFYIVDQNMTIRQAMKQSAMQTKPVAGYVWGTLGVVVVLLLAITIFSSLFISIPGATVIVSALLSPSYFFIFALRYSDIVKNVGKLAA